MTKTLTTECDHQTAGGGGGAPGRTLGIAAWPAEARIAPVRFPGWTRPDVDNRPRFVEAGDQGPKAQKFEERRNVYRQGGTPVRIKIVRGDGKAPLNVYRVVSDAGKKGWQPVRPAGFRAVPYFHQDANPFDGEGKIYWTGDEETADVLAQAGFQAFTFGVAKVGLPAGCEAFVRGRDVVVVAGNGKDGLEHAKVKADLAQRVAKSVRVVTASEVLQGDEVTCIPTATSEPEPGRLHNVSLVPAMPEVGTHHQTTPGRAGSSLEHSLAQALGELAPTYKTPPKSRACHAGCLSRVAQCPRPIR